MRHRLRHPPQRAALSPRRRPRAPSAWSTGAALAADRDGLAARRHPAIEDGRIAAIGRPAGGSTLPRVDLDGGIVLPRLRRHAHPSRQGPYLAAPPQSRRHLLRRARRRRRSTARRTGRPSDVARRMDFSLRCAYAHGTAAIRTHLDSIGTQIAISWPVFAELRERWAGRIALQACRPVLDRACRATPPHLSAVRRGRAEHGGVLGGVTYHRSPDARTRRSTRCSASPPTRASISTSTSTRRRTAAPARCATSPTRRCAIALPARSPSAIAARWRRQPEERGQGDHRQRRRGRHRRRLPADVQHVSAGPRRRAARRAGAASRSLHELRPPACTVVVACDNTRDPFYAYGDLDMLEVLREATRIPHLDHPVRRLARAPSRRRRPRHGARRRGGIARRARRPISCCSGARSWTELLSRPQADRTCCARASAIDTTLARLPSSTSPRDAEPATKGTA